MAGSSRGEITCSDSKWTPQWKSPRLSFHKLRHRIQSGLQLGRRGAAGGPKQIIAAK